jgi:hypothetical protein
MPSGPIDRPHRKPLNYKKKLLKGEFIWGLREGGKINL